MSDKEFISALKDMDNDTLIDNLEDLGGDGYYQELRSAIIAEIRKRLSEREKGEWIPVTERLPEMGVRVLCACQADIYDVLKLTPDGWFYDTRHIYMFGFVRAWQPLPEPYKAESEDI